MSDEPRRRSTFRRASLLVFALAIAAGIAPARGADDSRTVTILPDTGLVDFQYVSISFEGFGAGQDVRIRQCPKKAKRATQCKQDSQYAPLLREPGDSRLPRTNESGGGSDTFIIKAGELESAEGKSFKCDLEHKCSIAVFELSQDTFTEIGFDAAGIAQIPFARSTLRCPRPKGPGRIAGSGTANIAAGITQWQAETCDEPLDLQLSYIVTNSPQGKEAFVQGLADSEFAISSIALREHEKSALTAAARDVVQIPIGVGSLAFIFNYWEDLDRCDSDPVKERITDLRMSPETLAKILQGRLSDMASEAIADENPHLVERTCLKDSDGDPVRPADHLPTKLIKPVGRADNSSATWILTSWMLEVAPEVWSEPGPEFEAPTEIFPSYNAVDLRTGSAAVARQVRTFEGGAQVLGVPGDMWIGFVDTSVSKLVGLPSVAVRNGAGNYVAPSTDTVNAALQAATLNEDGTVTPNYEATTPSGAYPLPVVSYLITDKSNRLTETQAATIKAFAAYAITDGQDDAEERGYIPLPVEMRTSSAASIESIQGIPGAPDPVDDDPDADVDDGGPGVRDEDADDVEDDDDLDDVTGRLLARARGGGSGGSTGGDREVAGATTGGASPIDGSLAAQVGAPGGPAGVVRALTVFLGLPLLLALGFGSIVGGRVLSAFSDGSRSKLEAFLPRWVWRREN